MPDQVITSLRDMAPAGMWIATFAVIAVYLLPALIGFMREHPFRWRLLVVNVLLGWTGIGWIVTAFWAVLEPSERFTI